MENILSSLWSDRCVYLELDTCGNLNPNNFNFVVLQLNIRSILANQHEFNRLLHDLENKNSKADIILLSGTCLTKKTEKLANTKRYVLHTDNCTNHKGDGTAVLVKNGITHKRRSDLETMQEKDAESTYIKVAAKNGKIFIVGSLYRAPNTSSNAFMERIEHTIAKIK